MSLSHHQSLYVAYAIAIIGWLIVRRVWSSVWPKYKAIGFSNPWVEVVWAFAACGAIIVIGQFYQRGWRLVISGPGGAFAEAVNQAIIFSPVWLLLLIRGQTLETVWLPRHQIGWRLLAGVGLSALALLGFSLVKTGAPNWFSLFGRVYLPTNFGIAAQVFFEDVTIAMIMVRLTAALRRPWLAAALTGTLFAAGHIPAMWSSGVRMNELIALGLDFVLAAGVVTVLQLAGDIWWFWCVHFAMDMTQFVGVPRLVP